MDKMLKAAIPVCLAVLMLFLAACGSEPAHADLQQVYEEISGLPEMPEMLSLTGKRLKNNYGIDPESCPQAIVAICGDGLRVDEIWLIEAGSEAEAENVLALAQSRVQQICAETESYLPDQYAVAKQARFLRIGNCVGMFISPDASAMEELFRQAFAR